MGGLIIVQQLDN